jgi:MFS family permease
MQVAEQTKLTKEQKQAVGLLSIGTFLEYFDLMLYVHMAVLLNELFFPQADSHAASLFSAFAFCSTYALRPLGALIFGYLGDTIGRKHTVVITTVLMALSCVVMANLPTYAEIGISAAWIITITRMVQGISSVGELTGAQIYLLEITKPPIQYPIVASVRFFAAFGSVIALTVALFATNYTLNWRIAFWIGAGIALIGSYARATLRETPEFANARNRLNAYSNKIGKDKKYLQNIDSFDKPVNKRTTIALFFIKIGTPVCFYLTYIHYGNFLKHSFSYTSAQVVSHNFNIGLMFLTGSAIQLYLSSKINVLKIIKVKFLLFVVFLLAFLPLFNSISTPFHLFLFQSFLIIFALSDYPANAIFFKHFPVLKRFTYTCVLHAISHACIYVVTSFGFIYLVEWFGQLGVLFILVPVCVAFGISLYYFDRLEKEVDADFGTLGDTTRGHDSLPERS